MAEIKQITGTEYKLLVSVEKEDEVRMANMKVSCKFYTRSVSTAVDGEVKDGPDDDSRIVTFDTEGMEAGTIRMRMTVDIPDEAFAAEEGEEQGYRREIIDMSTDIVIAT